MIVKLQKPVLLRDGRKVDTLHLRIPPEEAWDSSPPGVPQSHWNLAQFANIDVSDVPLLSHKDIDALGEAGKELMRLHNRNVIGALPLSRAERRRAIRASDRVVNAPFPEV